MDTKANCAKCGAPTRVERRGHLVIIRCSQCGGETAYTIFPAEEAQHIGEPQIINVQVAWQDGRVTPKQALAVRKLIPTLDGMPLGAMLRECANSPTYSLGDYLEPVAKDLQAKAETLGLALILESRPKQGEPQ